MVTDSVIQTFQYCDKNHTIGYIVSSPILLAEHERIIDHQMVVWSRSDREKEKIATARIWH